MSILADATMVESRTGRKVNNALTQTFRATRDAVLAEAMQAAGLGVLFGFKNGGSGKFTLKGGGTELTIDSKGVRTTVAAAGSGLIGTIESEPGTAILRSADGPSWRD